jgi:hypothetical protein
MSALKWISVDVLREPLHVVFSYGYAIYKTGSIETLEAAEADNTALAKGHKLPDGRTPFFTKEETIAARNEISRRGLHIA